MNYYNVGTQNKYGSQILIIKELLEKIKQAFAHFLFNIHAYPKWYNLAAINFK